MTGSKRPMNPYLAGALAGIALALAVLLADRYFTSSSFYIYFAKLSIPAMRELADCDCFAVDPQKSAGWYELFSLGIIPGAAVAALLTGDFRWQWVPAMWRRAFGPGVLKRALWAFIGGFIAITGVRLAGGCPSGLGLSGMAQLNLGGFLGMAAFFVGGALMAQVVYGFAARRGKGDGDV